MLDRWITDDTPSERFEFYTRANADEVGPEPFSPLGWTLGWELGCIPGVADGYVEFGAIKWSELRPDKPEVFGNWGGYFYNQLSVPRVMGVRMPGASPAGIDIAYFGDHPGVPPYVADPRDEDEECSENLAKTMAWVMSTDGYPAQDKAAEEAHALRRARPELTTLSDTELVAYARSMAHKIRESWGPYCYTCLAVSLGPGAVQAICAAIGRPEDAMRVLSAVGGVESAAASVEMWDLSRTVAASADLTAAFDAGVDGILDRLRTTGSLDAATFLDAFAALLDEFGHRGPNEWDMRVDSWATKPGLPLGMIDHLRHQDDHRSPHVAARTAAGERERLTAELCELLAGDPETQATFRAGVHSSAVWYALREKGKNSVIRVIFEAKLALYELGRRMVERGVVSDPKHVFMITERELDDFVADPTPWADTITAREADFLLLHELEPPYIVGRSQPAPPISSWPRRDARVTGATVTVGEVLKGTPASPGVVTGTARIVNDPGDPGELGPDDVMVVHTTDPSWAPLFLSVGGVVCNVGAPASHAAIVSREVGVPCAVSVIDATYRIPDGATIRVDGASGTVEILALP